MLALANNELLLVLAIVLFLVAGVMYVMAKDIVHVLVCVGLAVFAWAFLVGP